MVLLTMIARQQDGLPLAASVQEDEQVCVQRYERKVQTPKFVIIKIKIETLNLN